MPDIIEIDARGHRCPVPTLKLRRRAEEVLNAVVITLLADDPMAQIDVPHFCNINGMTLSSVMQKDNYWVFEIAFTPPSSL